MGLLAASMMLAGCIAHWQDQESKARSDFQHYRTQDQERDNYQACVDQGALPGSAENLACQLELTKKEQSPAKAQNKPDSPATNTP
jgi:hypothetical protein